MFITAARVELEELGFSAECLSVRGHAGWMLLHNAEARHEPVGHVEWRLVAWCCVCDPQCTIPSATPLQHLCNTSDATTWSLQACSVHACIILLAVILA